MTPSTAHLRELIAVLPKLMRSAWLKRGDLPDSLLPEEKAFIAACTPEAIAALCDRADEADRLRAMLFLRHGCFGSALYGDDGEMQCKACRLDFKRDSIEYIQNRFHEIGLEKLAALSKGGE